MWDLVIRGLTTPGEQLNLHRTPDQAPAARLLDLPRDRHFAIEADRIPGLPAVWNGQPLAGDEYVTSASRTQAPRSVVPSSRPAAELYTSAWRVFWVVENGA